MMGRKCNPSHSPTKHRNRGRTEKGLLGTDVDIIPFTYDYRHEKIISTPKGGYPIQKKIA